MASSWLWVIVAPLVKASESSYPFGCAMVKSTSARHIHSENELGTACGRGLICGAHVNTTFGRGRFFNSVIVIRSARLCNGCRVADSRLTTGTPQNSTNLLNTISP